MAPNFGARNATQLPQQGSKYAKINWKFALIFVKTESVIYEQSGESF
jgi:hypothetical protein